jgi:hypothetical protein
MRASWHHGISRASGTFASRRMALLGILGAGLALLEGRPEAAGKKRRKRRTTCQPPNGRCGKRCVSLTTTENCGSCGRRCQAGEACQDGICCPEGQSNCRGQCRADCPPPIVNRPFPQRLAYGAIQPTIGTRAERDDHVRAAYDRWKARYLVDASRDGSSNRLFRVALGKPGTKNHEATVSEGQGYGMVIVAHMAGHDPEAQALFDGLWRFVRANPSEIDGRLMDWRVPGGDGNDSAFDGDCDIAYGLLLADTQWGSGGTIDYRAAFDQTISGIVASTIGPESRLPLLGDWAKGKPDNDRYNQYAPRTSDFMPGHFRAFRRATGSAVWDAVVSACQETVDSLQAQFSPNTGLLPDFVQPTSVSDHTPRPADSGFLEGPHDGDFEYNAGRDPWRLATDALLNGDARSAAQVRKIGEWARATTNGDPRAFRAGYRLDGSTWPESNYFTTFFVSPLGVAAMLDANAQAWLDAIYAAVHDRQEDYFEDSVTLLCLLVMTGNFWDPAR